MKEYLALFFGLVLVQNMVLSQFLGLCPFIGVSKKRDSAIGMGLAVIFVMTLASMVTMLLYKGVFMSEAIVGGIRLADLEMKMYLDIAGFILVIASLVQFVEIVMKKIAPALYQTLGIYLPLITTNCAVLGITQINVGKYELLPLPEALAKSTMSGVFGGIGFLLALILMAGVRERLELAPVPESFRGVPIAFLSASCMALAFFGFQGII